MPFSKRHLMILIFMGVVFLVGVCFLIIRPMMQAPTAADYERSNSLYNSIIERVLLDRSAAPDLDHPPVYCTPIVPDALRLVIYEPKRISQEENSVFRTVKEWLAENRSTKKVDVQFWVVATKKKPGSPAIHLKPALGREAVITAGKLKPPAPTSTPSTPRSFR